ncbi:hypothetical protein JMJ77_0007524 [Colletotrichum scovillei]|uniref:Uncharacterized protein n=1 Tax=Colletotrichum scovillei TaxID=1209932 RepID=A0A9P7RD61_9PEZI|nr:hypothetical protein JMJ77_0007524 [Colletotrichum scovillei]KAG7074500.1 hypothetical protein JMJ76_0010978 [Colletotrichum scovillei]KAG7081841.1 hypothetical protein JMJ78_0003953 [Colletotrichum scovillei]
MVELWLWWGRKTSDRLAWQGHRLSDEDPCNIRVLQEQGATRYSTVGPCEFH